MHSRQCSPKSPDWDVPFVLIFSRPQEFICVLRPGIPGQREYCTSCLGYGICVRIGKSCYLLVIDTSVNIRKSSTRQTYQFVWIFSWCHTTSLITFLGIYTCNLGLSSGAEELKLSSHLVSSKMDERYGNPHPETLQVERACSLSVKTGYKTTVIRGILHRHLQSAASAVWFRNIFVVDTCNLAISR